MARIARVIVPGQPHHITQRGNRRQKTFFSDDDYRAYLAMMASRCAEFGVEIWAWCLMPNHIHLIAVPKTDDALRRAIGSAHQTYTARINERKGWRGHLWQGRFASFVMDDEHLWTAARYIELNPVRARLAKHPADWPWSSARGHLGLEADPLGRSRRLGARFGDWNEYLSEALTVEELETFRRHSRTGRPLGDAKFLDRLETQLARPLRKQKPGPRTNQVAREAPGQLEFL